MDLLRNPPRFRHAGFDLSIPDIPTPGPDESWEMRWAERKLLRLHKDGTLVLRVAADESFLGWGQHTEEFRRHPRINPVTASEINAAFVHMVSRMIPFAQKKPTSVSFKLSFKGAAWDHSRLFVTEYYDKGYQYIADPTQYPIHSEDASEALALPIELVEQEPNFAAYSVLRAFFSMFEFPDELIPFSSKDGERMRFAPEALPT